MPDKPQFLTFAICADIHQDIMHDGPDRLRSFTQAAVEAQVDMAIQLGDFCQPTEANRPFLAIWEALETERYNVLGNHDMDGGATREQTVAYMSMRARFYAFDIRGWHCVVLDGNDPEDPPKPGYPCGMAADQIEWLRADLQGTDLPVLLFIHQAMDRGDFGGADDVLALLSQINRAAGWQQVLAVFSGHHHLDYANCIDGIWHIQMNSMSNYWMGEDFVQVRYDDQIDAAYPYIKYTAPYRDPLYAIVRLQPDRSIHVDGFDSQWVGPSPADLGYVAAHGGNLPQAGASVRPGISTRLLKPETA
ncbi:MAG: alkaline phosphatase [Gemmatimonadetes bacterium]|jgi:3',5'-cyclic AMP phosphodiesterase CpdA|nr:alkaline phosphatase [Gemmatimonadota bacterium]MBT5141712.1 alkaline phosphatase [Gemmatimonadota bacterium]MBT5591015.1 alkaline phosphatase [Gemmatimonadota bacterium]MBT5964919.1 alkaline phosphatase [Gemmatimonadota bacterium]MBT7453797.1 alkaline phosphatase [Gemmatimonadota bacterium]